MRVCVSARLISFPASCACCMEAADFERPARASRTTGTRVVRTQARSWNVPWCRACWSHSTTWETGTTLGWLAFASAIVVTIATVWNGPTITAEPALVWGLALSVGIGIAMAAILKFLASLGKKKSCPLTAPAFKYQGWNGSVQYFRIRSERYAIAFMKANYSKLVNVTSYQEKLLSENRATRAVRASPEDAATPAPLAPAASSAKAEADSEALLLKWAAKIEAAKGPATRRAALQSGLEELPTDELRARLKMEASRLEVQAALDKIEALKSVAAKKRTLEQAIESVRSDGVPDELQVDQIKWLEEALAELTEVVGAKS